DGARGRAAGGRDRALEEHDGRPGVFAAELALPETVKRLGGELDSALDVLVGVGAGVTVLERGSGLLRAAAEAALEQARQIDTKNRLRKKRNHDNSEAAAAQRNACVAAALADPRTTAARTIVEGHEEKVSRHATKTHKPPERGVPEETVQEY